MKKINFCILSAMVALLCGCSGNDFNPGEGMLNINANIDPTVKIIESRAIDDEETLAYLYSTLQVWISKDIDGKMQPVRQYLGGQQLPSEPLKLMTGHYLAEAWAGDSVSASFDKKYFKAAEAFDITDGNTTNIALNCKIANVAASVEFSDEVLALLTDYTLELGHSRGHLTFTESNIDSIAYFMMPSNDHDISWTLTGKKVYEGMTTLTVTNTIENVKPGFQYVFKISCASNYGDAEIGGARIKIKVDEQEILESKELSVNAGPIIQGYKFDIDQEQISTPGAMEHKNVWIFGAKALKSVVLDFPATILNTNGNGIDVVNPNDNEMSALEARGITVRYPYYEDEVVEESESVSMKILFDDNLTTSLGVGVYDISISATDYADINCKKTLRLVVKNDAVEIYEVDVRTSHAPKLTGHIINVVDQSTIVFCYNEVGSAAVQTVPATVDGENFYAVLEGLKAGTDYEFVAKADDFTTEVKTFTATGNDQLPNAGFEEWQTSETPYLIYAAGTDMFWDSGNHGSATMKKNVTVPATDVKHSGQYSIKLESQFVGIGALGKFAAGNVFIGEYLGTEGTDGIIGFGRPFTCAPSKIRCYIKYAPVAVTHEATAQGCKKGDMDTGIIYAALLDATTESVYIEDIDAYKEYPVVVKTKTKQLFDKTAANVIAYAEWTSNTATTGDGMVLIEIPFEYYRNEVPTYIMLTASASKYGDYFAGGSGTNMWIDDIELVYE